MAWEVEHIGACTLYRADCRDILPMLQGIDAVITDPPYGISLRVKENAYAGGYVTPASMTYADDAVTITALIREVMPLLLQMSLRMAVFPGLSLLFDYPRPESLGGVYVSTGAGPSRWGFTRFHPVLYYGKCPYGARKPNSFANNQPGERGIDHPCPKPLAWMRWLVDRASLPGERVLDPFMGSGTTGVACVLLGRAFIGIDIERSYFDIACTRIAHAAAQPDLFLSQPTAPTQLAIEMP
jgi:tRNA G10  N-methylase Trm11